MSDDPLHQLPAADGGMKSRKLWLTLLAMGLCCVAGKLLTVAALPTVIGGVVTLCALYIGGNTATRWVLAKHTLASKALDAGGEDDAEEPAPAPEPEAKK